MKPIVIGVGHKARQGKDAFVNNVLKHFGSRYRIKRYAFADALKVELYDLLRQPFNPFWNQIGMAYDKLPKPAIELAISSATYGERERINELKWSWIESNRESLLVTMQHYGEYMRSLNERHWLDKVERAIKRDNYQIALLADVRHYNEFMLGATQGYTVRVSRPGVVDSSRNANHISETQLDKAQFDYDIINDGSLKDLEKDSVEVFQDILERLGK